MHDASKTMKALPETKRCPFDAFHAKFCFRNSLHLQVLLAYSYQEFNYLELYKYSVSELKFLIKLKYENQISLGLSPKTLPSSHPNPYSYPFVFPVILAKLYFRSNLKLKPP